MSLICYTLGEDGEEGNTMKRELKRVDINNAKDLLRLVEEVRKSHEPRVVRRDNVDLVILMPAGPAPRRRRKRARTKADFEAFLSSAGSWKGIVDADKLKADIYESRRRSSRPAVEL